MADRESYDEGEFSSYFDERTRPMTRFLQNEEEQDDSAPLWQRAIQNVAVASAVGFVAHRSGAIKHLARFLETKGKGTLQALREIRDEEGSLTSDLSLDRLKRVSSRFTERAQERIRQQEERMADFAKRRTRDGEYDIERYIRQVNHRINVTLPQIHEEGIRYQKIIDNLRGQFDPKRLGQIDRALRQGSSGDTRFLQHYEDEQVRELLRKGGMGEQSVMDLVLQARNRYRPTTPGGEEVRQLAQQYTDSYQVMLRKQAATDIEGITKKRWNQSWRNAIAGKQQATVEDVLAMHSSGRIQIDADLHANLNQMMDYNPKFKDVIFDENLYVAKNRNGEITDHMDYKIYNDMRKGFLEWAASSVPGGIGHARDYLNVREARRDAAFSFMPRGTLQQSLNAQMGVDIKETLNTDYQFINGRFYNLFDHRVVNGEVDSLDGLHVNQKRKMYLTSGSFGTIAKILRSAGGILTGENERKNPLLRILDIGQQDKDARLPKVWSIVGKHFNENWEGRFIPNALENGVDREGYRYVHNYLKKYSEGLSARTLNQIKSDLPAYLREYLDENNLSFSNEEHIMKMFRDLSGLKDSQGQHLASPQFRTVFNRYERDPDKFMAQKTPIGESTLLISEYTNVKGGHDRIKQELGLELIRQLEGRSTHMHGGPGYDFRQRIQQLQEEGKILKKDAQDSQFLYSYHQYQQAAQDFYTTPNESLSQVNGLMKNNEAFRSNLKESVKHTNPWYEMYSDTRTPNPINHEYLAVNRSLDDGWKSLTKWKGWTDLAKQVSPLTGRRNMEDMTTASIFFGHYPVYRLQDALGDQWLGFSDSSTSSPLNMVSSLFLKRMLPGLLVYEGAQFADDATGNYTGRSISERWETHKAWNKLEDARDQDASGETDILKHKRLLYPGLDHWDAMPELHVPLLGEIGMGHVLKHLFFVDAPLDEKDTYSEEELSDYYDHGVDPVRKSKWWALGSKTAYRGDRITEFRPNALRMASSDWENTNVDLTFDERYSFARLLDPNYWEKKHYYDRPYMITGSLFNPNTPGFGDIGNATLGQLIKPNRRMHTEYWGDPVLMQESTNQYGNRPDDPIMTKVSPAGRMENVVYASPTDYGSQYEGKWAEVDDINPQAVANINEEKNQMAATNTPPPSQYFASAELDEEGKPTGAYVAQDITSNQTIYVPANIAKENIPMDKMFEMASVQEPLVDTKPRAMFDQEYEYRKEVANRKLRNLNDPTSFQWRSQEAVENWRELLGVYNWIAGDEMLGYDPYTGKSVIEKADQASNISNRFWGSNIGSLGGQISEIGRRFARRDDGKMESYNPIRNTMPDWLPGSDYFINFQVGDPYTKIDNGTYRLPGESYERLNPLHSDDTGRYGAFDKLKILADVAPWSQEYKFWRDYEVDNEQDEEIRKQVAQIKRQVSKRKKKYEFTDYHFKYADLETHTATVTKMLDDYTFLTKEFGDTPIRLAGMSYRPKAEGVLQSYIQVGDKVKLGFDADTSKQIAKDTYSTARAVVFKDLTNINQDILRRGLMKENQTDWSAPGVWSRFTRDEIKEGSRWESIAHFESGLNTKFLQVRTALEEYEQDQVYGKDWADWHNFMTSDYLFPSFDQGIRYGLANSLWHGAATGLVVSMLLGGGKQRKFTSMAIGAGAFAIGNLWKHHYESENRETWIPERRRKENDINEYFDLLKYMKYSGLYEDSKREAAEMGYDVDAIAEQVQQKKLDTKTQRELLEAEKKRLFLDQPDGWEERKKAINKELEAITEDKQEIMLPEPILKALQYKEESETTLYSVDPYDDRMKVARAFPYKDKWFFDAFASAPERDRERILQVVPENERRIYKALWGYGDETVKPLESYFDKYYLPDADWAGWRPEFSLDDIKVKVVRQQGLNLSDFNFWDDDVQASRMTPDLQEPGNNPKESSDFVGYQDMQQNIQAILEGQGLSDVRVTVTPSESSGTRVIMNYEEDRSGEIDDYLKYNMDSLV
jgi:hypothetical protein